MLVSTPYILPTTPVRPSLQLSETSAEPILESTQVIIDPAITWLPLARPKLLEVQALLMPKIEELEFALHLSIGLRVLLRTLK